jgi:LPXTG-motif cell wall-anchored protein
VVPSPAASGAPVPADSGDFLASNLWLVLAVILMVLILLLFFVLRRRRPQPG